MSVSSSRGGWRRSSTEGSLRPTSPALLAGLAVTTLVVSQLPTFLTAGVAVQIQRELGFGTSALGAAIGGSLATSALGSIVLGRLVQRIGWSWGMRIAAAVSALSLVGVAVFVSGWVALLGILAVAGIAKSVGHPAANLAIASEGRLERQGLLFGIKQAGVPATAMLAGLAVPALALTLGWRAAFWVAAGLAIAFGLLVPERPLPASFRQVAARKESEDDVHRPSLLLLAAGAGLGIAVANSLISFLTTYGVEVGLSEGAAGILLAVGSSTGLLVRVVIGWVADRRTLGLRAVSLFLVIGAVGVALLTVRSQVLLVVGSVLAFGAGWGWAGLFNLAVVQRNPHSAAVATGFTQSGVYVGAGLGPFVFGILSEQVSFRLAWSVLAVLALAAAAIMQLGDRAAPRRAGMQVPE